MNESIDGNPNEPPESDLNESLSVIPSSYQEKSELFSSTESKVANNLDKSSDKDLNGSSSIVPFSYKEKSDLLASIDIQIADSNKSLRERRALIIFRGEIMKQNANQDLFNSRKDNEEKNEQSTRDLSKRRDTYKMFLSTGAVIGGIAIALSGSFNEGMVIVGLGFGYSVKEMGIFGKVDNEK
jgi:hypothetical protein